MVAHAIAGSHLWRIAPEPRQSRSDAVAESTEASPAEAAFDLRRRGVLALLGLDPEDSHVVGGYPRDRDGAATGMVRRLGKRHVEVRTGVPENRLTE